MAADAGGFSSGWLAPLWFGLQQGRSIRAEGRGGQQLLTSGQPGSRAGKEGAKHQIQTPRAWAHAILLQPGPTKSAPSAFVSADTILPVGPSAGEASALLVQ